MTLPGREDVIGWARDMESKDPGVRLRAAADILASHIQLIERVAELERRLNAIARPSLPYVPNPESEL